MTFSQNCCPGFDNTGRLRLSCLKPIPTVGVEEGCMRRNWAWIAAGGLLILLLVLAGVAWDLRRFAAAPAAGGGAETVLTIPPGQSLAVTAGELERLGLVRSALRFRLLARWEGFDRRLKAGEYALSPTLTPLDILSVMEKGLVVLHRLTVPEGLTIMQIADHIERTGLAKAADIIARATDPAQTRANGIGADTLEGYLYPETYFFPRTVTPEGILTAMVARFRTVFTPEWERRAAEIGLSPHQAVTLASIVEKETGDPSERPLIASVFHNRLKRGMRLETDPTVIYGLKNFDGNLTRRHLESPTPYNTYLIKGLPPGPIASPGKESLRAALFPAQSDYLYFVSKNNGNHQFSTNLADHNRAVHRYQLASRGSPAPKDLPPSTHQPPGAAAP
jgi:UPF0755 protein